MLAVVLASFEGTGVEPDVTVVDRCATPLELCRWYARHMGTDVATAVADATDLHDDAGFDVICAAALLPLLPPETRGRALVRWRELLRPGGRIATSARISTKP